MKEARDKFEAIFASKGRDIPEWSGNKYTNDNVQTYWRWFLMGWTMSGGSNE